MLNGVLQAFWSSSYPSHHPIPRQRLTRPARLNRLREVRPHQFGLILRPVGIFALDADAFEMGLTELTVVCVSPAAPARCRARP
jgi:hypothetical protein